MRSWIMPRIFQDKPKGIVLNTLHAGYVVAIIAELVLTANVTETSQNLPSEVKQIDPFPARAVRRSLGPTHRSRAAFAASHAALHDQE